MSSDTENELNEAEDRIIQLERANAALTDEVARLKRQSAEIASWLSPKDACDLITAARRTLSQLDERTTEIATLRKSNESLKASVKEHEQAMDELQDVLGVVKDENNALKAKLAGAEKHRDEFASRNIQNAALAGGGEKKGSFHGHPSGAITPPRP